MTSFLQSVDYCVFSSPLHGDGVKASRTFEKDEVVYFETPLHFLQTIPNRQTTLVCSHCSNFLGSVALQMKYLQKQVTREQLTNSPADAMNSIQEHYQTLTDVIPCSGKCGELYCSEMCREAHWQRKGHKLLCTGHIPDEEAEDHPLFQFKIHAISTNEIFLMVADIFAEVCVYCEEQKEQGKCATEAAKSILHRYKGFVRKRWWDAVQAPKGQKPVKFKKTLQNLVTECWDLLSIALSLKERGLDEILSEDFLSRTIGMFEQNNVGVRLENPIARFMKQLDNDSIVLESFCNDVQLVSENATEEDCCPDEYEYEDDAVAETDDVVTEDTEDEENKEELEEQENEDDAVTMSRYDQLIKFVDEEGQDSLFPPLDGTSFYLLTCKINHSCDPNVIVTYTSSKESGLQARLHVLKTIQPEEEFVQSYIDQSQPLAARRAALVDYGFTCSCSKCQSNE